MSSARSFAMVGFMIVGIECIIETHRCLNLNGVKDNGFIVMLLFTGLRQMCGMPSMVEVLLEVKLKSKVDMYFE